MILDPHNQNEVIGISAMFIGLILVTLLIVLVVLGYGKLTEYEEQTSNTRGAALNPKPQLTTSLFISSDPNQPPLTRP